MTTLPATLWEQLAVVGAFIAFTGLVWVFLRWVLGWAKSIISEQRTEWQAFMKDENAKTRDWLNDQECNNRKVLSQVAESLEAVNDNLHQLADDLRKHDQNVPVLIQHAVDAVNKLPAIRKPKV